LSGLSSRALRGIWVFVAGNLSLAGRTQIPRVARNDKANRRGR
jgi:hypothetical protein